MFPSPEPQTLTELFKALGPLGEAALLREDALAVLEGQALERPLTAVLYTQHEPHRWDSGTYLTLAELGFVPLPTGHTPCPGDLLLEPQDTFLEDPVRAGLLAGARAKHRLAITGDGVLDLRSLRFEKAITEAFGHVSLPVIVDPGHPLSDWHKSAADGLPTPPGIQTLLDFRDALPEALRPHTDAVVFSPTPTGTAVCWENTLFTRLEGNSLLTHNPLGGTWNPQHNVFVYPDGVGYAALSVHHSGTLLGPFVGDEAGVTRWAHNQHALALLEGLHSEVTHLWPQSELPPLRLIRVPPLP